MSRGACARCGKPRRGAGVYCVRCERARRLESAPLTALEVYQIRLVAEMPQTQFADELGVSPITVARWETGTQTVSRRMSMAIRTWARHRKLRWQHRAAQ